MTGVRWVVAGLAAVLAAGLVVVVLVMDLEQGEKIASVAGAVVSVLLAGFTVVTAQPAGQGRRIRAGRGATVIDGSVTGSALGRGSKVTGPPTTPAPAPAPPSGGAPRPPVDGVSGGRDSTVILGDVRDSALGDESERR
ncbi:hypothetical protein KV205_30960 [Streptomyces sp. SKN60]|uniref:hypothetical protein n=1 Tax=Streptomyces sp. SKN60 TaxID=2855506 RepID=UPI0022467933|nr:hypothetical protein [Streptomyces sp. SKN60]MCX2184916.1 hypothetical protein [Streptomyces sp. SKN60]